MAISVTSQVSCIQGASLDNADLTPTSILSLQDALNSTGSHHGAERVVTAVDGHNTKLKAHPLSSFGSDISEDSLHLVQWDGKVNPLLLFLLLTTTAMTLNALQPAIGEY